MPQIMFEIYRETVYQGGYRVVYFTELEEHNKELEIGRAMAGEHFYDGFIATEQRHLAKEAIGQLLDRLNKGERITPQEVDRRLSPFSCQA
jgi:hypothetical protein